MTQHQLGHFKSLLKKLTHRFGVSMVPRPFDSDEATTLGVNRQDKYLGKYPDTISDVDIGLGRR